MKTTAWSRLFASTADAQSFPCGDSPEFTGDRWQAECRRGDPRRRPTSQRALGPASEAREGRSRRGGLERRARAGLASRRFRTALLEEMEPATGRASPCRAGQVFDVLTLHPDTLTTRRYCPYQPTSRACVRRLNPGPGHDPQIDARRSRKRVAGPRRRGVRLHPAADNRNRGPDIRSPRMTRTYPNDDEAQAIVRRFRRHHV